LSFYGEGEALARRAEEEAKAYHSAHRPLSTHMVLLIDRASVLDADPESRPERIPEARAAPKPEPEPKEIKVIRHWMIRYTPVA
jgi:hypothetical protein